jgi:zinc protease
MALSAGCSAPTIPDPEPLSGDLDVPLPETFQLAGGLSVWLVTSRQVPMVSLTLATRTGSASDPDGLEGLTSLMATMLDEGAGERGPLEIAEELDFLGASLHIGTGKEVVQVSLDVLKRNLGPALDILSDVVLRPRFDSGEWDRVKALALNNLTQRREDPSQVARVVSERAFYGEAHPFGHPSAGYEESVKTIRLVDIQKAYKDSVRPENSVLVVVGDISRKKLEEQLEGRFGSWKGVGTRPQSPPSPPVPEKAAQLIIVDKPGVSQTAIRILLACPPWSSPEIAPLSLANTALGGTFTSRLVSNLREKNGYTYGARSVIAQRSSPSHLVAASSVYTEKTAAALVEFCREFRAMKTGNITGDEFRKVRATHWRRTVEALQSQNRMLGLYALSAALGFPPDERRQFHQRLQHTSLQDVSQAARETFDWDPATIVLVGDRKAIEQQLAELEAHPEKDREGNPCTLPEVQLRGREGERLGK